MVSCIYHVQQRLIYIQTYKHKSLLPEIVSNEIKHLFSCKDLGSDELLSKCLDCKTQNANESINYGLDVPREFMSEDKFERWVYHPLW